MYVYTQLDQRMIQASVLAYEFTQNGPLSKVLPGYDGVGFDPSAPPPEGVIRGFEKINSAFVGRTDDGNLVVAFRGTIPPGDGSWERWVTDWLNDFRAGQVPWSTSRQPYYGMVEHGFAAATLDLWPEVETLVAKFMAAGPAPKSIVVTGHSKGAALAPLAATLLRAKYPAAHIQLRVYAQPMTGDQTFANNFAADGLSQRMIRFQREYDLVPFLPDYWTFTLLASGLRAHGDAIADDVAAAAAAIRWAYVDIGYLVYVKTDCTPLTGSHGYDEAKNAIERAVFEFQWKTIMDAHSARSSYAPCIHVQA
jgi:hypothetical protein